MGYGFDFSGKNGKGWGFASVSDWLDSVILSFPAPWKVCDLDGKYYGTLIADARGIEFLSFWMTDGEQPSARQKGDMTDEEWSDYCCDSHWESARAFATCEEVVRLRNLAAESRWPDDEDLATLRSVIVEHGRWEETIDDEIKCGGPDRRETSSEHDIRSPLGGMSSEYRGWLEERQTRACKACGEIRTAGRNR